MSAQQTFPQKPSSSYDWAVAVTVTCSICNRLYGEAPVIANDEDALIEHEYSVKHRRALAHKFSQTVVTDYFKPGAADGTS